MLRPLALALATELAIVCSPVPASAQGEGTTAPETPASALGVWTDRVAQARRLELARTEMRVAELVRARQSVAALGLLEWVAAQRLARDEDSLGRLLGTTRSLEAPGGDPGWLYAGIPVLCVGAVATLGTGLADGLGAGDDWSLASAYMLAGAVLATGLVLLIVGLVEHTFDPTRRAFFERRRRVVRAFVDARRELRVEW